MKRLSNGLIVLGCLAMAWLVAMPDAAAQAPPAPAASAVVPVVPRHVISVQGRFLPPETLAGSLWTNDAVFLTGGSVSAPHGMTMAAFLAVTQDEATAELIGFLANAGIDPLTDAYVIIDVEYPLKAQKWGTDGTPEFYAALKMRVDVVRETMPNCRLGLYGTPFFPAPGTAGLAAWRTSQLPGYTAAIAAKVLDSCDVMVPVCRSPLVVTDASSKLVNWQTIGMNEAATLSSKPQVAFLAFEGTNGAINSGIKFPAETLLTQLRLLYKRQGIDAIILWGGHAGKVDQKVLKRLGSTKEFVGFKPGSLQWEWTGKTILAP